MDTKDLDIVCFSPVRWDVGGQRPQQLLRRAAQSRRVFFIEEPILAAEPSQLLIQQVNNRLWRVIPQLSEDLSPSKRNVTMSLLLHELIRIQKIQHYLLWYFTPKVLDLTRRLKPEMVIYDCLTSIDRSDPRIAELEVELLHHADLVITDGQRASKKRSLFSALPDYYPGSLDLNHYFEARIVKTEPADQAKIPHPRLGFFGVINHLFDLQLVRQVAELRPDWHLVLLGPLNTDPGIRLDAENIHYLSTRSYDLMPAYVAGWDAAILPAVQRRDSSTISGFQAPLYLAAGCPVISTPVPELVQFLGRREVVWFARTAEQFVQAVEEAMARKKGQPDWLSAVDQCLIDCTWDMTWTEIERAIEQYQPVQMPARPYDNARIYSPEHVGISL